MAYFPGNIMIIDDKFDLVFQSEPEDYNSKIQYHTLSAIKSFCEDNGIPLISISKTDDAEFIQKRINSYNNVRLLVLDLDLNDDGFVNEEDDYLMVNLILTTALKKFGYFMLMINSAHTDSWEAIKQTLSEEINYNLLANLTFIYDKLSGEPIWNSLNLVASNYSLELLYHFESELNNSRDKAFFNFLDFNKESWKKIVQTLQRESGNLVNNDINQIIFSILKQFMKGVKYPSVKLDVTFEIDEKLRKLVYMNINYSLNRDGSLSYQKRWTGNLYKTTLGPERRYALIINPECDLAQNKYLYYKVVYGFEKNEYSFPETYDNKSFKPNQTPPLLPFRAGKNSKNQWKSYDDLKNLEKINDHLLFLPFASETEKNLFLDFRDVDSLNEADFKRWKFILRVNDPLITFILDTYSNLFNRKGLLPLK